MGWPDSAPPPRMRRRWDDPTTRPYCNPPSVTSIAATRSPPGLPNAWKRAPQPRPCVAYFLRLFDWRVAAALGATYLFFGSGPAAAAAEIKSLPPFLMVACRGLIAGVIL